LTKHDSFDHITNWIEEVHRHTPADLPIVLVGNKSDLVDERKVSREEATALAEQMHLSYMETSALNASNVEQAFTLLVTSIYNKKKPKQIDLNSDSNQLRTESVSFFKDNVQTRTISVSSTATTKSDKPIRPSYRDSTVKKKPGCCVIS